jgi:hypothetical protein
MDFLSCKLNCDLGYAPDEQQAFCVECLDSDSDGLCDADDACPYDAENDIDADNVCGDVDMCPYDYPDDIDGDGICDGIDTDIGSWPAIRKQPTSHTDFLLARALGPSR